MKAGAPSIQRLHRTPGYSIIRIPSSLRKLLYYCQNYTERTPRIFHNLPSQRYFSSTANLCRPSLAERIKQFLPEDATESSIHGGNESDQYLLVETPVRHSLAAYETEVSKAVTLVNQLEFKKAGDFLLENLPLQVILSALMDRIVPTIQGGPLGHLGITEFANVLFSRGHSALASQLLHGISTENNEHNDDTIELFWLAQDLRKHEKTLKTAAEIDSHMQPILTNIHGLHGLHFPQMLSNVGVSAWIKVHLLAQLSTEEFRRWLSRYSECFEQQSVALLTYLASPEQFEILADWILRDKSRLQSLLAVLPVISSHQQFHQISRPLLRASSHKHIPADIVRLMLSTALRLKQSYDIANICKKCDYAFSYPEHITLMAKALLAAAFAQRKPGNPDLDQRAIVFQSTKELRSFLVSRVLTPVAHDSTAQNAVIGLSASRLLNLYPRKIPGKVLWKLLLSLPGPLKGSANAALAKLVVKRPYIEQVRYMAMPIVTVNGIRELLKWHITKIMDSRRVNTVPPELPQAQEDIQLLVAGLLLAAEKSDADVPKTLKEATTSKGAHSNQITTLISEIFEKPTEGQGRAESPAAESAVVESPAAAPTPDATSSTIDAITRNHETRELSTSIAFHVIAELVRQKSYTVAKQLFSTIGPTRVSAPMVHRLLLSLAKDHPEDSYKFVLWLSQLNKKVLRPATINEMMSILTESPQLTESQLMNRFQSLRQLLRIHLNTAVEQEPATNLVDALIRSAIARQGGSLQRLQWALGIAKHAGVPEAKFDQWAEQLDTMRDKKQGYWSNSL